MKMKKVIKIVAIIGISGIIIGGSVGLYMFNMPQRDVPSTKTDYSLTSTQLVSEYLLDYDAANLKYLAADGNSKVLEITGEVNRISEDFNGQKVVLLKGSQDQAGVNATFTPETNNDLTEISIGQTITVKGVIRSGASYDEDLGFYLNVVLEKSSIVK